MQRFVMPALVTTFLLGICGCHSASKDLAAGKIIFQNSCVLCHGVDGRQIPQWRAKVGKMTGAQIKARILNGGSGMPSFKDTLTPQEVNEVAAYAMHLASS